MKASQGSLPSEKASTSSAREPTASGPMQYQYIRPANNPLLQARSRMPQSIQYECLMLSHGAVEMSMGQGPVEQEVDYDSRYMSVCRPVCAPVFFACQEFRRVATADQE